MKIVSFNVNGIRSAQTKGFVEWLAESDFDIIGLQETKAWPEQVDMTSIEALGYSHFWVTAEKKGYSGVAILTKQKPILVETSTGIPLFDSEGRVILAHYGTFTLITAYFPTGSSGDERQEVKYDFLSKFEVYLKEKQQQYPNIIVMGDYNICHRAIDIHDPVRNKDTSGFLPEERAWMDMYFTKLDMVDSFRAIHGEAPDRYSWWSYRAGARKNNKGWRIDYIAITQALKANLVDADILDQVVMSDHCPLMIELNV